MTTTTQYGSWLDIDHTSATLTESLGLAVTDWGDDYDLTAAEADYRAAINDALPSGVQLAGNDFYGPAYEQDQKFDGYPLKESGKLDLKAIVEDIDLMAIIQRYELWTAEDVADHLGYQGDHRAATARKRLSAWGVKAHAHTPHPTSGRVQARYLAREVEAAAENRPGQGKRTDRPKS